MECPAYHESDRRPLLKAKVKPIDRGEIRWMFFDLFGLVSVCSRLDRRSFFPFRGPMALFWKFIIVCVSPAPDLLQKDFHVDTLALHLDHPGVLHHAPRSSSF